MDYFTNDKYKATEVNEKNENSNKTLVFRFFFKIIGLNQIEINNEGQGNQQAILLKQFIIRSLVEFSPNKILAHYYPNNLLIIKDWEKVHYIDCSANPGNVDKLCLVPMPGFDEENFPFIVSSGHESLNLINVKNLSE